MTAVARTSTIAAADYAEAQEAPAEPPNSDGEDAGGMRRSTPAEARLAR
ncbi:MAG TPA: hypothetical protein VIK68_08575 [Sphingomicrobium sp.]